MLMYGYANNAFWFSFANPKLVNMPFWLDSWLMVGNALPNRPPPDPPNATFAACILLVCWVAELMPVNEWFCTITGNPHDMGIRLALAGMTIIVTARTASVNRMIFFTIYTTLLLIMDIQDVD